MNFSPTVLTNSDEIEVKKKSGVPGGSAHARTAALKFETSPVDLMNFKNSSDNSNSNGK